jgi:hypothetical protein
MLYGDGNKAAEALDKAAAEVSVNIMNYHCVIA